jgi:L-threonylcarbamoyladenylate synthase
VETLLARWEEPSRAILDRAAALLNAGCLLIYPTDTLYALGGRAHDASAAVKVRGAKGRDFKPLPTVAADLEQARGLCSAWPKSAELLARHFWPGPLSLILPARDLPQEVTGPGGSVAVRVPALRITRELCLLAGALISTSANLSGAAPPVTCAEAVAGVGGAAALAIDAGPGHFRPSTLVDLTGEPREVRPGAVSWADIREVLLKG